MYNIVEFDEAAGGGLAIVHAKWLTPREKEVFWPPYKEHGKFNRALKNGGDINYTHGMYMEYFAISMKLVNI